MHIVVFFALICICTSQNVKETIYIFEEIPEGSTLANIAELFGGSNEGAKYKLVGNNIFISEDGVLYKPSSQKDIDWVTVGSFDGEIKLIQQLDRDVECKKIQLCSLQVQIIRLPDQQLYEVNFLIKDLNDNKPIFPQNPIEFSVKENIAVGETLNLDAYMARDSDSSFNGEIEYRLSDNPYFGLIESTDGEGFVHVQLEVSGSIDYEETHSIELTVFASDRGIPPQSSTTKAIINIEDINDNKPIFRRQKYSVNLKENQLPGHEVVTVQAVDADSGDLGQVQYYLSRRNNHHVMQLVAVDPQSGAVTLREKLDREIDDGVRILIEATDLSASEPKISLTIVVIHIEDVNDNAPVIHVNYVVSSDKNTAYVKEDSAIGTFIARVSATDADDGNNGKVELYISSSKGNNDIWTTVTFEDKNYFALSEKGFVETTEELDRETCDKYSITITACDLGNSSKCSQTDINVVVLDVNEYPPIFQMSSQIVSLYENMNVGREVITVHATDEDSVNGNALTQGKKDKVIQSRNGEVTFSITDGGRGIFEINEETGKITLMRPLDREVKSEWVLTVEAKDGGFPRSLESYCDIIIEVDDVNDNRPFFVNPALNNSLIYTTSIPKKMITKIKAVDYDVGTNAHLVFSIVSIQNSDSIPTTSSDFDDYSRMNTFTLDASTGVLSVGSFGVGMGMNHVEIQVCDSGVIQLCSKTTLRVMVTNAPLQSSRDDGSNLFILAVTLGIVAVLLVITIPLIVICCRKKNKKLKSYGVADENNRFDFIAKKRSHSGDDNSFCSDKTQVKYTFQKTNELQNQNSKSRHASNDKLSSNQLSTANSTSNYKHKHHSVSDGDSGKGDSEPDNFEAMCESQRINFNQQRLSSTCSEVCLTHGHSDACWMPATFQARSLSPSSVLSNCSSTTSSLQQKNNLYQNICMNNFNQRNEQTNNCTRYVFQNV